MFNNTNIWDPYGTQTASTQPISTGVTASTPASSQTYTSNLPGRVYQARIPITGDISSWTQPDWLSNAIGTQWYTDKAGDPYLMAYATSPLSTDVPWNYINTLGYDPTTFMAMQQNAITSQGSSPTSYAGLVSAATEAANKALADSYAQQTQSVNDAIQEYIDLITAAMTPEETSTTTSTTNLDLPAGFRKLPMPLQLRRYRRRPMKKSNSKIPNRFGQGRGIRIMGTTKTHN